VKDELRKTALIPVSWLSFADISIADKIVCCGIGAIADAK
jgi:hypothetical protein